MIRKVLVTGDKGYIGSVLVSQLLSHNYEVIGFDTDYYASSIIPGLNEAYPYPSIHKDIRRVEKKDIEGVDAIIHLCALSNDPMGNMDESLTEEINYSSTVRLAELAKSMKIKRFIFSSSCSIYGKATADTVDESCLANPLTAYARSKINSEKDLSGMATPSFFVGLLRNSTVYGFSPKFRDDLVVNNLVVAALVNHEIRVMSDGTPWRPLIDVRDLGNMFLRFLIADSDILNGKVVNIGFKENNFQVKDIVDCIQKQLPSCAVKYTGEHGADTRSYRVSFDLLHESMKDIKQEWTLYKSVADLIVQLTKMDTRVLGDKRFTRIQVLHELVNKKLLSTDLYWNKLI